MLARLLILLTALDLREDLPPMELLLSLALLRRSFSLLTASSLLLDLLLRSLLSSPPTEPSSSEVLESELCSTELSLFLGFLAVVVLLFSFFLFWSLGS